MLAAACCLIALGIGIYVNTVTSPPRQLNYPDQYKADVSADINMLTAATDTVSTDSLFFSILHKIDFEQSQQKYDGTARDGLVTQFIDGYVPKFIRDCHRSFNASVWHQSDHRRMLTRIDELMAITVDSGNAKAVGARADSLENIRTVISHYNEACRLAASPKFQTVSQANNDIRRAHEFAGEYPLSNCTELVSNLQDVESKLNQSHYAYLEAKVRALEARKNQLIANNYFNNFEYDFHNKFKNNVYNPTIAAINEYINHTNYSSHRDVSHLRDRCNNANTAVRGYYMDLTDAF